MSVVSIAMLFSVFIVTDALHVSHSNRRHHDLPESNMNVVSLRYCSVTFKERNFLITLLNFEPKF